MTIAPAPIVSRPSLAPPPTKGSRLTSLLRTTDHKTIGLMYMVASFGFFMIGGLMAMLMRGELAVLTRDVGRGRVTTRSD
jgi:cytochrome c oxidase subunit 1